MKVSKDFYIWEFVPRIIYRKYGNNSIWFIRPEIISLAQFYRDYFGKPVYVNNWYWGGPQQNRGYRTPGTKVGATYSQHKLAAAFDCNIKDIHPDEVRQAIMDDVFVFMEAGLTTLESGEIAKTWIHSDIRPTNLNRILIVKP